MTRVIKGCKQVSCNIAGGSPCVEGNKPEDCPYIVWSDSTDAPENEPANQLVTLKSNHSKLYTGDELTPEATYPIMRSSLTHLVALAGGQESGKTSLLTCIYDCFQQGMIGGYLFAGSKTLPGFELRCFSSRIESHNSEATTERTLDVEQFRFLHLAVRREQLDTPIQHLLFSDITGEAFNEARKTAIGVEKLKIFLRADHFVVIVNGESLANPGLRHKETNHIKTLIRALLEGGVLLPHAYLDIVINKWDLILESADKTKTEEYTAGFLQDIETKFSSKVARLTTHKVAALPKTKIIPRGFGVEKLFVSWVESSSLLARRYSANTNDDEPTLGTRSFSRFRTGSD